MELPNLNTITEGELLRIKHYDYTWLDSYQSLDKKDPRYGWHLSSLLGEMVEKLIYEKLLFWASESPNVNEYVLKGPYVHENPIKKGFSYNPQKQIYYLSSGETIGEIDALFRYNGCYFFVEIKYTDNKSLIKKFKYELLRKYNLLRLIFPDTQIRCLVITSYSGDINVPGIQHLQVVRIPKYDIDPGILKQKLENQSLSPPGETKFKRLSQLKYHHFDYLSTLSKLHMRFNHVNNIKPVPSKVIKPYIGLIERYFLGSTTLEEFNAVRIANNKKPFEESTSPRKIYLAYKLKESDKPKKVIYVAEGDKKYYEVINMLTLGTKRVYKRKRTYKDIKFLSSKLRKLKKEEVSLFVAKG